MDYASYASGMGRSTTNRLYHLAIVMMDDDTKQLVGEWLGEEERYKGECLYCCRDDFHRSVKDHTPKQLSVCLKMFIDSTKEQIDVLKADMIDAYQVINEIE